MILVEGWRGGAGQGVGRACWSCCVPSTASCVLALGQQPGPVGAGVNPGRGGPLFALPWGQPDSTPPVWDEALGMSSTVQVRAWALHCCRVHVACALQLQLASLVEDTGGWWPVVSVALNWSAGSAALEPRSIQRQAAAPQDPFECCVSICWWPGSYSSPAGRPYCDSGMARQPFCTQQSLQLQECWGYGASQVVNWTLCRCMCQSVLQQLLQLDIKVQCL
jgi:hypothetical protein